MASISALTDDFDTLDTAKWPGNYGNTSVSGSRGRIQTTGGVYGGWMSSGTYSVPDGAAISVRVYPDVLGGATVESWTGLRILANTLDGTDLGIMVDRVTGNLVVENRTSYFDGSAVSVTYSSTTMAFWRIRRSGSNILVETAPESSAGVPGTWTTRRTIAVPAWMSTATNMFVLFEAYRNNGTAGYSEMDYFNTTAPVGGGVLSRTGMFF